MKNELTKYIVGTAVLAVVVFLCWYFSSVIAYILIAAVLSFLGRPVSNLLERIRIRGRKVPDALRAGLTLAFLWFVFLFFVMTVIPLVVSEFQALGTINTERIASRLEDPLYKLGETMKEYGIIKPEDSLKNQLIKSFSNVIDLSRVQRMFGSLVGTIGDLFIALFSISFISFFFIKDNRMFTRILMTIAPARYADGVRNAVESVQHLLMRYFVGIFCEVIIVMVLNVIGLSIVGLKINHAVLIGLITGITNVIPYLGPLLGIIFGLTVGVVAYIDADIYTVLFPMLLYMSIPMLLTQLVDNIILQPVIYGTSVYAHPLEIFLVILIAGNLAGIPGMILAIPGYTVLRVVLREFFNKYRLVKQLTHGLEETHGETRG